MQRISQVGRVNPAHPLFLKRQIRLRERLQISPVTLDTLAIVIFQDTPDLRVLQRDQVICHQTSGFHIIQRYMRNIEIRIEGVEEDVISIIFCFFYLFYSYVIYFLFFFKLFFFIFFNFIICLFKI